MTKQQEATPPRIHRHMTIDEIFSFFPHKAQRLSQEITNAGLHCVGCSASTWETLEAGMMSHGMNNEAIERLVKRLNALLEEPVDMHTITLTERAASKFLEFTAEDQKPGFGLRFGLIAAGCSGFEYELNYSEKAEDDDTIYESHGVKIHVKKAMAPRLIGSSIDFVEGLRGSGFKVTNPNVKSSCGCGSSQNF